MAKTNITLYSSTPSENTDIDDINIDEGCPASGLNNALRSLLSHLKNVDTGSQALTALSVTGALSAKGGAVFNEDSANVDFRVESNDDANMFRIEGATNNVKIGSNAGNYGQLSIKNEKAGSQERGLYIELSPTSGTSPNNIAVFSATNSNMTQPLVRIHHESPTADQLLLQATTTGSNTVKFSVDEDGDIYTAGGINLGGTGSANYLDDYEEGGFTPTIGGTATYSRQIGHYTKVGDLCFIHVDIIISTMGTGSVTDLSGLPFTSRDLTGASGHISMSFYQNLNTASTWVGGYVNNNTDTIYFNGNSSSQISIGLNRFNVFQNGTRLLFSGVYKVA